MPGKDIVENLPGNFWKGVTLFNAVCWGSSYISTKAGIDALSSAGVEDAPVVFGALRFVLAALPLLPWLWKSSSPESARSSAVVGSLGAVAYAAVFVSFSYGTTGAKAAFITALQTTVVASLSSMAAKRLNLSTFCSALLALGGVGVLEFSSGPVEATIGDLICMASPILIGLSWHVLGESTKKFPKDATPTAAIQLLCFGMLFAVWSLGELLLRHGPAGLLQGATHFPELLQTPGLLPALLFSAFFGNTVTMLLSSEAMKRLKASDVSLIVASEPLWAALAAAAFLGEGSVIRDAQSILDARHFLPSVRVCWRLKKSVRRVHLSESSPPLIWLAASWSWPASFATSSGQAPRLRLKPARSNWSD